MVIPYSCFLLGTLILPQFRQNTNNKFHKKLKSFSFDLMFIWVKTETMSQQNSMGFYCSIFCMYSFLFHLLLQQSRIIPLKDRFCQLFLSVYKIIHQKIYAFPGICVCFSLFFQYTYKSTSSRLISRQNCI